MTRRLTSPLRSASHAIPKRASATWVPIVRALKANDRLGVRMSSRIGGAGGYLHWCKYRDRREPMPCAIVIGAAPVIVYTGPQKFPTNVDEIEVAGGLAGEPIRMAKCVTIDLEVPADSEIVIEGLIDPELLEPEGPFGESHGYVALEDYNMSMQVTAITHRRAPVFASIISQVTPSESSMIKKVAYEPMFLAHLRDQLGIKGIRRVVMHEPLTNIRPVIFLQFANGAARTEVWRALRGAASLRADCGKIVVAVSEDIDPANTDAVLWSLAYRANLSEDLQLEPYRTAGTRIEVARANQRLDPAHRRHAETAHVSSGAARAANSWRRPAHIWKELGLACARPSVRRGTAIRWATGTRRGTRSRAMPWRAPGTRTAKTPLRGAVAASSPKRRCAPSKAAAKPHG